MSVRVHPESRVKRRGRRSAIAMVVAVGAVATVTPIAAAPTQTCGVPSLRFDEAENRFGNDRGFEPGIEIDRRGVVWTTAPKLTLLFSEEMTRSSSYLYRSIDNGASFRSAEDLVSDRHPLWGAEGDLAIDGADRAYFVDTWAAESHLYRFGPTGILEDVRPFIPTAELDDRPWLAAHHDGVVYYMAATGYSPLGSLAIHRSLDRGSTWSPGFLVPDSGWGFLDADPNSNHVYAVVNDDTHGISHGATEIAAWISNDLGATWTKVRIAEYTRGYNVHAGHDDAFPTIAVSPADGSVYALWTDDGAILNLARSTDHGLSWAVEDVTPFTGTFSFPWLAVAEDGTVGIVFEARRSTESLQRIYAMQWRAEPDCLDPATDEPCAGPASVTAPVNEASIGDDYAGQLDFFQTDFSPTTGRQHVVWTGLDEELLHRRTSAAPSMSRAPFCGTHVVGS